jgi:hypothetical protein
MTLSIAATDIQPITDHCIHDTGKQIDQSQLRLFDEGQGGKMNSQPICHLYDDFIKRRFQHSI